MFLLTGSQLGALLKRPELTNREKDWAGDARVLRLKHERAMVERTLQQEQEEQVRDCLKLDSSVQFTCLLCFVPEKCGLGVSLRVLGIQEEIDRLFEPAAREAAEKAVAEAAAQSRARTRALELERRRREVLHAW